MAFNKGFMCAICGPIPTAKKKAATKRMPIPYNLCPDCMSIVHVWERPLNERSGRCGNCGESKFESAIVKSHIIRNCKTCGEAVDIDQDCKVIRKGDSKHAFKK